MNGWDITTLQAGLAQAGAYIAAGGVVMWPLVGVSLAIWILIIERLLFFRRLHRKNMPLDMAWQCVVEDRLPDPKRYRGLIAHLITAFIPRRSHQQRLDRHLLDELVNAFGRRLDNRLALIGVLAAVAPLLGLLGTVMGMMETFSIMALFGTGDAKGMAGGISEALVTTQTGLLVAIPGLYMKGFLEKRAENLRQRIVQAGYYLRRRL